jgi:hypothetical protein
VVNPEFQICSDVRLIRICKQQQSATIEVRIAWLSRASPVLQTLLDLFKIRNFDLRPQPGDKIATGFIVEALQFIHGTVCTIDIELLAGMEQVS